MREMQTIEPTHDFAVDMNNVIAVEARDDSRASYRYLYSRLAKRTKARNDNDGFAPLSPVLSLFDLLIYGMRSNR